MMLGAENLAIASYQLLADNWISAVGQSAIWSNRNIVWSVYTVYILYNIGKDRIKGVARRCIIIDIDSDRIDGRWVWLDFNLSPLHMYMFTTWFNLSALNIYFKPIINFNTSLSRSFSQYCLPLFLLLCFFENVILRSFPSLFLVF